MYISVMNHRSLSLSILLHVSKDKRHVEHERSDGIGGTVANTKKRIAPYIRRNPHIGKERNKR